MPDRPNILWLMTDEQRADSLGVGGASWTRTPHLDNLTRRGTRFAAAYTPSPVCVSARAAQLTGRACSSIGVLNNHQVLQDHQARLLTQVFADAGYRTAGFGKHHYNSPEPAFQTQVDRVLGDRVGYFEYRVDVSPETAGVVRYPATEANRAFPWILAGRFPGRLDETPEAHTCADALAWLHSRDPDQPYLLRLSFNAPHTPVVAPEPFDTIVDSAAIDLPIDLADDLCDLPAPMHEYLIQRAGAHRLTTAQIQRTRQCYYGSVTAVDALLGQFLEEAGQLGALENTIVAFVSDHGAHLADHGFYQKQSFFDVSARVPWTITGPEIRADQTIDTPVSTGSLLPTLIELADLEIPAGLDYPSLAVPLRGGECESSPVFSEIDCGLWDYRPGDRYVMIRQDRWKLVLYRDPSNPDRFPTDDGQLLFDLREDPQERTNLAGNPKYAPVATELIGRIDAWDHSRSLCTPIARKAGR